MDLNTLSTIDNRQKSRFELNDGADLLAFIDYKIGKSGNWYLVHTEVVHKEGKGIGVKIVRESLQILEDHDTKLVPTCPFVKAYIKKNVATYRHLLADGVKLDD